MRELIGFLPVFLVTVAVILLLIPLVCRSKRYIGYVNYIAMSSSIVAVVVSFTILLHVVDNGVTTYFLGGFRPPLGIVYTVDTLSALLGFLSMIILLFTVLYSTWFITSKWNYLYYSLLFLMATGSIGCFYTGDIFNFYVALELLTLTSSGLVAFYRDKPRAITAALRYVISGTIATSLYFFSVLLIYSAFGTLNIADIALKTRNPVAQTPFSHTVPGDIIFASKVAVSIMVWVFLFKSAILPIGFAWQPHVYAEAPVPIAAGFTAISDTVGLYMFMRMFNTVFGRDIIPALSSFRTALLSLIQVVAIFSALTAALLMTVERDIKKFIAYSTISQFSLALLGISLDNNYGIASAILLIISNTLGDAILFYIAGIAIIGCGRSTVCLATLRTSKYALTSLVISVLNLFGIIPVVVGFWAKALLVLAGIEKSIIFPVAVLAISGITAIGYFRLLHIAMTSSTASRDDQRLRSTITPISLAVVLAVTAIILGLCFALYGQFRESILNISVELTSNYKEYITKTLQS